MTGNSDLLSEGELALLKSEIRGAFEKSPPTIGVIGVSGVGKSSTINSLFKTNLATSHTVRCTTEFTNIDLEVTAETERHGTMGASLRFVDAPGLGEDVRKDDEYIEMYKQHLPACDVVVWVMTARNRAVALDQMYLARLEEFSDRIVFALNQIDLVEPIRWNTDRGAFIPSEEQEANLKAICEDREERLSSTLGRDISVNYYSAATGFRMVELLEDIVNNVPDDRRWMFGAIKKITPEKFLDGFNEEQRAFVIQEAQRRMAAEATRKTPNVGRAISRVAGAFLSGGNSNKRNDHD